MKKTILATMLLGTVITTHASEKTPQPDPALQQAADAVIQKLHARTDLTEQEKKLWISDLEKLTQESPDQQEKSPTIFTLIAKAIETPK